MATVGEYLQTWKLKLSTTKTVSADFEAACWLGWSAGATTLRTSTLTLVNSTAGYCAPVWYRSAHTCHTDPVINNALQTLTGCLRPIPLTNLPIIAGIQLAELRSKGATLSPACHAMESGHLLHSALPCPPGENARHFKSRHPTVPAAHQLVSSSDSNNRSATLWADHQWNAEWLDNITRPRAFIPGIGTHPPGMTLPRTAWVRLNRLRTGIGRFRSCLHKWGYNPFHGA